MAHPPLQSHQVTTPRRTLTVSIVIPSYNEAATLPRVLARVVAAPLGAAQREIIVVDDGSTDGSADIIRQFVDAHTAPGCRMLFIEHPANAGKGAALKTALARTTGDIVIIQDADLEYDPADYAALLRPIADGLAPVVYGSRWLNRHFRRNLPGHWRYVAGNWIVTRTANVLFDARVTDQCTGYKIIRGDIARGLALECAGFEVCSEITARLRRGGHHIWEIPIDYRPRSVADGKKIRAIDGLRAIWTLARLWARLPAARAVDAKVHAPARLPHA